MALAEALKSNTTLKKLESATLPSNPPAHAFSPHSMQARCTCAFYLTLLLRLRRLEYNGLGPEGGMALAEALKSNTALETLRSAAQPLNPPAHASMSIVALIECTPPPLPLPDSTFPRISLDASHVLAPCLGRGHAFVCLRG